MSARALNRSLALSGFSALFSQTDLPVKWRYFNSFTQHPTNEEPQRKSLKVPGSAREGTGDRVPRGSELPSFSQFFPNKCRFRVGSCHLYARGLLRSVSKQR
jgi:hypothetical protein